MNAGKDARIQFSQASSYIQLLSDNGTKGLPKTIAEHLDDGIWELRPGNNRVFFFFYDEDGTYVLLHQIRKKTQKPHLAKSKEQKQNELIICHKRIKQMERRVTNHDLGRI